MLCEDSDVLIDSVVEDRVVGCSVEADSLCEDSWDVAGGGFDVVLEFNVVGKGCVDEDSLLEVVADMVGDDVILDFVVVDEEDRTVDSWTIEEAEVVANVVSRLEEETGRSVDDGLVSRNLEELGSADEDAVLDLSNVGEDVVDGNSAFEEADFVADTVLILDEAVERRVDGGLMLEDVEEIVSVDDDVALELLRVSEDKVDASTLEDWRDIECVEIDSLPVSVEALEDGRDVAGVVINVVFALVEEVVRRVDDDLVLEGTEEVVGTDDDVILGPVDVDATDVDSKLEAMEDVACVEVDSSPRSIEAVEGKLDDKLVGEDG